MAPVTKFNFALDNGYIKVLNGLINRCHSETGKKLDSFLLIEGKEGTGKTTLGIATAYYIADQTKRPFDHTHVFFDVEKLLKFAQDTEKQIIVWDEPALQALSSDSRSKISVAFKRLMMTARKKRHFIIVHVTYFNRFDNYILDRCHGMARVYERNPTDPPRFQYFKSKQVQSLFSDWFRYKKKNYSKYKSRFVGGTFPNVLDPSYKNNVLSHFDVDEYEKAKDSGIQSIEVNLKPNIKINEAKLKWGIYQVWKASKLKQAEVAEMIKFDPSTIRAWGKIPETYPQLVQNP